MENSEEKKKYRVISLFSGCGGLDLGFKRAGFEIVWANEKDKDACASFRLNFPETELIKGNIKLIKDLEFPEDIDVLIGGYPCQGFSIGGSRRLDDKRNLLYREFGRCLKVVQPKIFLAENVKGLLTMGNRMVVTQMIKEFAEKNYKVKHKLYNAKQFGVPQDRERVFLVGVRKDLDLNFFFPKPKYGPNLKPYKTFKDNIWHLRDKPGEFFEGHFTSRYMSRQRKRKWNEVCYCIMASAEQNPLHPDGEQMKKVGKDKFKFMGDINRRLSIKECLIIQSFTETFRLEGSLKKKYRQVGNAVPPLLAENLAMAIKKCLDKKIDKKSENSISADLIQTSIASFNKSK